MEKLDAIMMKLQSEEIETLQKYHNKAIESNSQNFEWEQIDSNLKKDYPVLKALDSLGYVNFEMERESRGTVYDSYFLTLFPSAMYRADYENSSQIKKWLTRNKLLYKDWMALLGFVLSSILTIIKLFEIF